MPTAEPHFDAQLRGPPPSRVIREPRLGIFAVLALATLACFIGGRSASANALAGSPSPYLAMHGEDPVDWRPWGPEVFEQARAQNKPIFVSSGYFACHWCHVMQRESYRNPAIAALLNRHFIPVKVDRELRPALDTFLIGFVERTAGQAGWPLNVFLTPEGYPLIGLTYSPPTQFEALLQRVAKLWAEERADLKALARRAAQERIREPGGGGPNLPDSYSPARLAGALKRQSLQLGDRLTGGFGHQSRFPMAPNLMALLALQARTPDPELEELLRLTLDSMMRFGLRDHLGGGFFRYTVDPAWHSPHFEKMLYSQALLATLYLRGADVLQRPTYRDVARETLDFMLRDMQGRDGGFIASLSAVDDKGIEGGYYLWDPAELTRLLDPDQRRLLIRVWGLDGPSPHEAGSLPIPVLTPEQAAVELRLIPEEGERLAAQARVVLLAARDRRRLPRDDKQLAGWNGLALSALAVGSQRLGNDSYRNAASRLRDYLAQSLWDGERLHRARSDRGWIGEATLGDYAYVAQGLRDWGRVSGSQADLDLSRLLVRCAWELFYDRGWRLSADSLLPAIPAEPAIPDSPLPSPAAVILALSLETGDEGLQAKAQAALRNSASTVDANPFAFAGQTVLYVEPTGAP
ncbi:MAG: DUF255 domain-containing protein [Chromatiaceae bacterium]